ncbi:MAG: hypothetical protein AB7V46_02070, partial [Thermomicrobiales bacterium]
PVALARGREVTRLMPIAELTWQPERPPCPQLYRSGEQPATSTAGCEHRGGFWAAQVFAKTLDNQEQVF